MRAALICIFILTSACQGGGVPNENLLRARLSSLPARVDPLVSQDAPSQRIYQFSFESLLAFDSGTPEGRMAKTWDVSEDGKSYVFCLKDNLIWHDLKPVKPEDIVFSFEKWKASEFAIADALKNLDSIKILGTSCLQFQMKTEHFRDLYILGSALVIPKHVYEQDDPNARRMLGSGPYEIVKYEYGKDIVLKAFKEHRDRSKLDFETIVLRHIIDDQVAWNLFKKGEVDYLELNSRLQAMSGAPKWSKVKFFNEEAGSRFTYIGLNLERSPLDKLRFRQGMAHAFPWDELEIKLFEGNQKRSESYFFSSRGIPASPLSSNRRIAADFFKKFKHQSFELLIPAGSAESERMALTYQAELVRYDIQMSIRSLEWTAFLSALKEGSFDAFISAWVHSWQSDPYHLFHSEGSSNFFSYKNSEVDKLVVSARRSLSESKRQKIYTEMNKIIWEDLPVLFLFERPVGIIYRADRIREPKTSNPIHWQLATD